MSHDAGGNILIVTCMSHDAGGNILGSGMGMPPPSNHRQYSNSANQATASFGNVMRSNTDFNPAMHSSVFGAPGGGGGGGVRYNVNAALSSSTGSGRWIGGLHMPLLGHSR